MGGVVVQHLVRKARHERQVGGSGRGCLLCGEADWRTLRTAPASLLEEHHVGGRNHDPELTVPLCLNCHAKVTERQRQCGADLRAAESACTRVASMLRSLAAFLFELAESVLGWADELEASPSDEA
jgi:hypothetical protein